MYTSRKNYVLARAVSTAPNDLQHGVGQRLRRMHDTTSCDAAAATTHTYMLANEGDGIGAHVTVGENVLFFRVQAAVESAHAQGVTVQQSEATRC